ncbi:ABC transporter ATP-binding protein domain containing protein [Babesia bovis T2Bo]|uniref:ABC transporter ATP-binding protein domain containing protein n=1 Tax=Babesia bovis T2Bo TaxID=484906 RepID=UPI001C34790E|nr:ABC transporter ATP-binding protein domain containing protein [Babesia bovis T2Bo]EDO05400.2 ABC transporter ATP-binding protein domain containing protein [Babesia bovis T2Bo]
MTMTQQVKETKDGWFSWLKFWNPSAVKKKAECGDFSVDNGYGSYAASRGLSFISFSWVTNWVGAVAYGDVGHDNYPPLPCSDFDTFASTELGLHLMKSRGIARGAFFSSVMGNMRLGLLRVYRYAFSYLMLLTILKDAMELFVVCLMRLVVSRSSLYSGSAILSLTVDAFIEAYHHFYYRRLSLRLEITLHTLLFGKILARDRVISSRCLSDGTVADEYLHTARPIRTTSTSGENDEVSILNLALFDVYEVSNGVVRVVDLLNIPIKVFMLTLWLYGEMGSISIKTVALLAVSTVIMLLCECQCASLLKEYVRRMDLRLFKTQVVLEDLRNLRLVKWAGYAMSSVMGSRVHELQLCLKRAYLSALSSWVGMVSPFTMAVFIFVASAKNDSPILRGMNLDKSLAFPLLHALNYFIRPLKRLPSDINDHMETTLSCGRLEDYVCRKVLDIHIPTTYDRFSERVPTSNYECRHPYKVDESTVSNLDCALIPTLKNKFRAHIPLWMCPRKSVQQQRAISRSISGYEIGVEDPHWQFLPSRDTITIGADVLRDSYMGIEYPYVVDINQASFAWNTYPVLSNISLKLCCNQVTLLLGPPGSGKTSLLNAIIGELQLLTGTISVVPWEVNLPIGYISQDPWISVGTVRECILFGHPMDIASYNQVVSTAGLDVDFSSWENGDQRSVDEGGQNLSTGQRMRISLARCLYNQMMHSHNAHYSRYTLYCLDDMFSVLDPALSVDIFKKLFGPNGLMTGASVLMVIQPSFAQMLLSSGTNLSNMEYFVYHIDGISTPPRHETLMEYMSRLDSAELQEDRSAPKSLDDVETPNEECSGQSEQTQLTDSGQQHGALSVSNFTWLINHVGIGSCFAMVFLAFTSVSLTIFSDQVVRSWGNLVDDNHCEIAAAGHASEHEHVLLMAEKYSPFMRDKLNHYYVYVLTNALKIVLCMGICFVEPLGTFQAARTIYSSALGGVLRSPMSIFNNMRIGTINNRLSTDQTYVDYNIFTRFSHTTATIIYSTMCVITVCILNWWSGATIPFVILLTFIIVIRDYMPMCRENMRYILGTRGALCTMISQTMTGASVIRSAKREGAAMSQFLRYLDVHERAKFLHTSAVAWSNVRIRLLSFPLIFVNLLSPLISLLFKDANACGTAVNANLGTALMYSLKLSKTFKALISLLVDVSNTMCACQRLQELSRLCPGYDKRIERLRISLCNPCVNCGRHSGAISGCQRAAVSAPAITSGGAIVPYRTSQFNLTRTGVIINDLTVDYVYRPACQKLDDSNTSTYNPDVEVPPKIAVRVDYLAFGPGEHVGIVGRTGSGKSTLLAALAGAVDLASGSVTLDGLEISTFASDECCDAIGNIPHNPPLLVHWTIRDYVDPRHEWDDIAIWDALFACSIGTFVRSLPGKNPLDIVLKKSWQNKCNDRSVDSESSIVILDVHLQYLSLARLLLYRRDLRMLLVDESSVVSCEDEHELTSIPELLHRLFRDCNLFLVAHHAESLRLCDRIVVLNNGHVVGQCSPSEVVDQFELATRCSALASGSEY